MHDGVDPFGDGVDPFETAAAEQDLGEWRVVKMGGLDGEDFNSGGAEAFGQVGAGEEGLERIVQRLALEAGPMDGVGNHLEFRDPRLVAEQTVL